MTDDDDLTSEAATITINVIDASTPTNELACEVTEEAIPPQVTVTNNTDSIISSWEVRLALIPGDVVTNYWNATLTGASGIIKASNSNWNGTLNPGANVGFGLQATHNGLEGRSSISCE